MTIPRCYSGLSYKPRLIFKPKSSQVSSKFAKINAKTVSKNKKILSKQVTKTSVKQMHDERNIKEGAKADWKIYKNTKSKQTPADQMLISQFFRIESNFVLKYASTDITLFRKDYSLIVYANDTPVSGALQDP